MRKLHAFLFAFLLLFSLASASRVFSRLEFNAVDSSNMTRAAVYDPNAERGMNCARTELIEDEKFVKITSGMAQAFQVVNLSTGSTVFFRPLVDDSSQGLLYVKPTGAQCYYWKKATAGQEDFEILYKPRGLDRARIDFSESDSNENITRVHITEGWSDNFNVRRNRIIDSLGFAINGTSANPELKINAFRGFDMVHGNTNQIYSTIWDHPNNQINMSFHRAPYTTALGSKFLGMSENNAMFSVLVYNQ